MMNVNQLPNEWINTVNHLIKNSKSNAYAVFNAYGELLFANESMHHFLNTNHELKPRNTFINPQFDELIKLTSDSQLIFDGLLTIGNYLDQSFVLNAKVFKQNNTFLVFGEADVFHLFEENRKMSTLNQQVNNLQRQLIKEKKHFKN